MNGTDTARRRPAAWTALCFGAGCLAAHGAHGPVLLLMGGALGLFVLAVFSTRVRGFTLFFLMVVLGALRYEIDTEVLPFDHILRTGFLGEKAVVEGVIHGEPERAEERVRFALELETVTADSVQCRVSGRMLVTVREVDLGADCGDRVALKGRLRRPSPARNPGAFDYRAFLAQRGIHATLSVRREEQIVGVEPLPGPWVYEYLVLPVRRSIRATIRRNLSGAPAGLLQGMLLGEKYRIPEEVRERFRSTGLAHALVISGLHVGLIAAFFFTTFKLCRLSDRLTCGATILVLVLYALVTELQPPVVRAALMAGVVLGGRMLGRGGEIYNSLGLAALLILALWPASLLSLSFQLSFGATLAIVGLHRPLSELFPKAWRREDGWVGKWVVGPLCVSLAAQIGTGPLIAHHFQQCAPVAPLANLVVVPLLAVAVGLGVLAALVGACVPLAAIPFNACNYLALKGLIGLVGWFAEVPGASLNTLRPGVGFLVWAGGLAILGARMPTQVWARKAGVFLLLVGLNVGVWAHVLRAHELEVVFLDVGQGDAAFLRFPNGRTMVVDGGERSEYFDYGEWVLVPFLRYRGIERIDAVVASHPHSDHVGGLVALLEGMEVGHYLDSGQRSDTWTAGRLRELIGEKGIVYHRVTSGDSLIGLGDVGILVLHPSGDFVTAEGESPHNTNNGSVVVKVTYGEVSLLFTGDVEEQTDGALRAWGERLRARVLKVAHHGSPTSSTVDFVSGVSPELAVVSVGEGNKFGHPSDRVLARYARRGAQVLRTDGRGAVVLRTDGEEMEVETVIAAGEGLAGVRGIAAPVHLGGVATFLKGIW